MARTRVRWGRVAALLVVVTAAVLLVFAARAALAAGPADPRRGDVRAHRVAAGETVWEIARDVVGREGDPRPVVDEILAVNGVDARALRPGQTILVPSKP